MQKQYVNVEQVIELDKAMWILREHIVRWGTRKNKFPSNANVNGSWMGEKERGIIGGEVKEVIWAQIIYGSVEQRKKFGFNSE